MTFSELKKVGDIFLGFKLNKSYLIVKKYLEFAETKIHSLALQEICSDDT